jgi:hypothetical protein
MIDSSREVYFWGFERVVGREVYGKEENTALERTIALERGILISHRSSGTEVIDIAIGWRTESHTGPIIVACQWN